jgi:hypothetical protein
MALYDCLFEFEEDEDKEAEGKFDGYAASSLEEYDHIAVSSVHAFLQVGFIIHDAVVACSDRLSVYSQNLYFYATQNTDEFRRHMLMETLLIPRLILPYLDRCGFIFYALHVLSCPASQMRDSRHGPEHSRRGLLGHA